MKTKALRILAILCVALTFFTASPTLTASIPTASVVAQAATVKLNKTKITMVKGQTKQIKIKGTSKKVKWSSSKKSVATVSSKGVITAKGKGQVVITAKVNKKKYTCKVTVETPSISKKTAKVKVGKKVTLKVKGTNQSVTWSSSNKKIATVSKGVVKGVKPGKVTITAKLKSGKKYKCTVTVKVPNRPEIKDISNSYMFDTRFSWTGNHQSSMDYDASTGTWNLVIYALKNKPIRTYYVKFECVDSTGATVYSTIEEAYYAGEYNSYFRVYNIPKETTMIYCSDFI